jgi:hypothetical protein
VTEAQWLSSADPDAMLDYLAGRITERKLRLFACACVRRHWSALADDRSRRAVEVAERFADGLADEVERYDAWDEVACLVAVDMLATAALYAVEAEVEFLPWEKRWATYDAAREAARYSRTGTSEGAAQSALLRCIVGPCPFATPPRTPDTLRAWGDRTVPGLARTIYDEHAFDLLPVLADALEEAGCSDEVILEHLRAPGPHARGCFALDSCLLP